MSSLKMSQEYEDRCIVKCILFVGSNEYPARVIDYSRSKNTIIIKNGNIKHTLRKNKFGEYANLKDGMRVKLLGDL
jgi:hypothetical protein